MARTKKAAPRQPQTTPAPLVDKALKARWQKEHVGSNGQGSP